MQDRCFAFNVTTLLLLSFGLPVCIAYLLDRSSRRHWVRRLAQQAQHPHAEGQHSQLEFLITAAEQEYWGTYDLLAGGVSFALLVLPLGTLAWQGALALALRLH